MCLEFVDADADDYFVDFIKEKSGDHVYVVMDHFVDAWKGNCFKNLVIFQSDDHFRSQISKGFDVISVFESVDLNFS